MVWLPHLDAITFPWPFPSPPMCVETYSVFWNEKLTTQELTKSEFGKLLDLRFEWADNISAEVSNWNCRDPPPI